jgi:hypothetical protein
MGRKRWAERRRPALSVRLSEDAVGPSVVGVTLYDEQTGGRLLCGAPMGDGSVCMVPAGPTHRHEEMVSDYLRSKIDEFAQEFVALSPAVFEWGAPGEPASMQWRRHCDPAEEIETPEAEGWWEDVKRQVDARPPYGLYESMTGKPLPTYRRAELNSLEFAERPTSKVYDTLKFAADERADMGAEQAVALLNEAIPNRPRLIDRITDLLGPALAGQLARAVTDAIDAKYAAYLADERASVNALIETGETRLAELMAESGRHGEVATRERWSTPSRLS